MEKLTVDDVQNECVIPTTEPEMIEAESVQIEDARPHTEQVRKPLQTSSILHPFTTFRLYLCLGSRNSVNRHFVDC